QAVRLRRVSAPHESHRLPRRLRPPIWRPGHHAQLEYPHRDRQSAFRASEESMIDRQSEDRHIATARPQTHGPEALGRLPLRDRTHAASIRSPLALARSALVALAIAFVPQGIWS